MSPGLLLQWLVVALLVLGSALYSAWRLLPAPRRLRLVEWLLPAARHAGLRWPGRLRERLLAQAAHACGGCGGGGPAANPATGGAARTRSAAAPRR